MQLALRHHSRHIFAWGVVFLALLSTVYLSEVVLNEDYRLLLTVAAFAAGAFSAFFILGNWRIGVVQFFVWVVFEDLLRKFLGNSMTVYEVKDFLIVVTYVSFALARWRRREQPAVNPIRVPLLLFVGWVIVQTLNPNIDNFAVPILGLRMSLMYIPLLYLGYSFIKEEKHYRDLLILMMSVAGLISLLGLTQAVFGLNFLNPDSAPNLRLYLTRTVASGQMSIPRPTATFVDAGRFASYVLFMSYLGLGLIGYLYTTKGLSTQRQRFWAIFTCATVLAGLFLSGGRAGLLWILLSLMGLYWVYRRTRWRRTATRRAFPFIRVAFGTAVVFISLIIAFPQRFEAVYQFFVESVDPTSPYTEAFSRPRGSWDDTVKAFSVGGLMGNGTGSASLGLLYLTPYLTEDQVYRFRYQIEGGFAVVLWEWGAVGLFLWLWWSFGLMRRVYLIAKATRGTRFFWPSTTTLFCFGILLFPSFATGMSVYQNYITQSLLWFTAGMVFRFPTLIAPPSISPTVHQ